MHDKMVDPNFDIPLLGPVVINMTKNLDSWLEFKNEVLKAIFEITVFNLFGGFGGQLTTFSKFQFENPKIQGHILPLRGVLFHIFLRV